MTRPQQRPGVGAERRQEDGGSLHVTLQSDEADRDVDGGDVVGITLQGRPKETAVKNQRLGRKNSKGQNEDLQKFSKGCRAEKKQFSDLSSLLGASGSFPAAAAAAAAAQCLTHTHAPES